jgi:hypothetical protein
MALERQLRWAEMSGQKIMFEEVERGHDAFVKNEPRDLFYRAMESPLRLC